MGTFSSDTSLFFTEAGDGTGDPQITIDASLPAALGTFWKLQPPVNEVWYVERMVFHILCDAKLPPDGYGAGPALSSGICLTHFKNMNSTQDPIHNFTPIPITTNADWVKYAHHMTQSMDPPGQVNFMNILWDFTNTRITPIRINGKRNEALTLVLTDDFSDPLLGLLSHTGYAHGKSGR